MNKSSPRATRDEQILLFGLMRRRLCPFPTWRGWICILILTGGFSLLAVHLVYPFLAVNQSVTADTLVVEGWAPKYALKQAEEEFHRGNYRTLFVTGGVIEEGSLLADYKTYANLGSTILLNEGFPGERLQSVPAGLVQRDRTYASALTLKQWMAAHGGIPAAFNVISVGTHSRRTWLLFQSAFENQSRVGIISVRNRDFDPSCWWHYSQGVRSVIDEAVAYLYARFCFSPGKEPQGQ